MRLGPCNLQLWASKPPLYLLLDSKGPYKPFHQIWGLCLHSWLPPTPVEKCLEAFCALQDWREPRGPPLPPNWPLIPPPFLMASTTCKNLQKGHFGAIRKETTASHKEGGFSCQPGHWLPSSRQTLAEMYPSTHDPRISLGNSLAFSFLLAGRRNPAHSVQKDDLPGEKGWIAQFWHFYFFFLGILTYYCIFISLGIEYKEVFKYTQHAHWSLIKLYFGTLFISQVVSTYKFFAFYSLNTIMDVDFVRTSVHAVST